VGTHLISFMLLTPFVGALAQGTLPSQTPGAPAATRMVALGASLVSSVLAILAIASMSPDAGGLQVAESIEWISSYAITYEMGLDGLNAPILLLLAVLFPVLIAAEWNNPRGRRGMHGLLLLLQSALMGAVCAQDLFVTFFFWTMSALPLYFLVAVWGNDEGREQAAFRLIVSATLGNALLFAALILIYHSVDPNTFLLKELSGGKLESRTFPFLGETLPVAPVCVALISLGLALRVPLWPLHGWFTRAAEEAPFPVLAAQLVSAVSVGTYLFVRLCYSLFPATTGGVAEAIVAFGLINLLLGALGALAQTDLRRLLAQLALVATGLILIGAAARTSASWVGLIFQQFASGLALAGMALLAGILRERTRTTEFRPEGDGPLGGIAPRAPSTALAGGVFVAALLGFPGLVGFVGQSLLIVGSYPVFPAAVLLVALATLIVVYQLFRTYRAVFLGASSPATEGFVDLSLRERAYLLPLIAAALVLGIYPKPLIDVIRATVAALLAAPGAS
jgi:NADH-quinone oxidoreductase subunit M